MHLKQKHSVKQDLRSGSCALKQVGTEYISFLQPDIEEEAECINTPMAEKEKVKSI